LFICSSQTTLRRLQRVRHVFSDARATSPEVAPLAVSVKPNAVQIMYVDIRRPTWYHPEIPHRTLRTLR